MRLIIKESKAEVAVWAKDYVIETIKEMVRQSGRCVLGLPTGSTPLDLYRELIKVIKKGEISFKDVITFNMDEYIGLGPGDPQSYHHFMMKNLFGEIDILHENINIPDGMAKDIRKECLDYEKRIEAAGGIDLFIGGVGADGHIAFNEPFSSLRSRTREKTLTEDTKKANSRFFNNDITRVPRSALTVGVATIMDAKEVMILALGEDKSEAVRHGVEGYISHKWTITALQMHPSGIIVCDKAAASRLKISTLNYFANIEA